MKDADLVGQAKAYCSWLLNPGTTVKTKEILVGGHKAGYIENIITQDGSKHYASCTMVYGNPGLNITWHNDTEAKGDIDEILNNITFL